MTDLPIAIADPVSGFPLDGVDQEIRPLVAALWAAGIGTLASCSGHGYRPGTIALRDGREMIIAPNYDAARRIDSLFPLNIQGDEASSPCAAGWTTIQAERAYYVDGGINKVLCDRLPSPVTLLIKEGSAA